ncbi:MAG: serine protein kinase RIO [Sulfolobales archaeon]
MSDREHELFKGRKEEKRYFDSDLLETVEEVFDSATIATILNLIRSKCLKRIKGVISAGKEARVYWGESFEGRDIALKIYYVTTSEFRRSIWKYLAGDPRFEDYKGMNWRRLIYLWASKEYSNLIRLSKAGVRVPKPLCKKNNVIVLEFIGKEGVRAPLLKEAYEEKLLSEEDLRRIYEDLIEQIHKMVVDAGIVHADLSEYNIMIYEGKPYIIDVSQAVSVKSANALEFLRHDIYTIVNFFRRAGVETEDPEHIMRKLLDELDIA